MNNVSSDFLHHPFGSESGLALTINIIFDLDGTLIDSRTRMFELFRRLVPVSSLDFSAYWALKRRGDSHRLILERDFNFNAADIQTFTENWMQGIEAQDLLNLDQAIPHIEQALTRLKDRAHLYVCTARQSSWSAENQMATLGILKYFEKILVTEQLRSKTKMLEGIPGLGPNDWLISDSGRDVRTAEELGIKSCAVLTGFESKRLLLSYEPDLILQSAADFEIPNQ